MTITTQRALEVLREAFQRLTEAERLVNEAAILLKAAMDDEGQSA